MKAKPKIIFNETENLILFDGVFMATNSWDKRGAILKQFHNFIVDRNHFTISFCLVYVDSMSRKIFFEMFSDIKSVIAKDNKKIDLIWKYDPDDETIFELGEVLQEVVGQPINFIEEAE